ncbi:RHS repeat-associated core domain-containing protein [Empedobacter sp. GD03861]|uniref:DUF6443 domain-containing protein n=1 Tax=Empedobacter sp. GD03861 TaxID=2975390 RepID=UPI00244D0353|nr:DUF6443 domain-containing protein [Empedobacter sp. GD03861]MDH0675640.1 RHS repeat-associated core domain-containing protein [Empedobacter sp. GD03861]
MKHFYKNFIYSTFLALGSTCIQAQTTTENFIKTQECLKADCSEKKETVVYFDGLGREKQILQVGASPLGKTIVTPIEYDGFGRQAREYLPFPIGSAANTVVSPTTNGNSFYSTLTGDTTPFSEKTFENSPLNRVIAQAAPGNSWKKGAHEIRFGYDTNVDGEVYKFGVDNPTTNPTLTLNSTYQKGVLYKTVTTDENGQPIQEFKDKEGRVVLKRINIPAISGNSSGNHDTYYVYDIYGNLTFVLPPKLIDTDHGNIISYRNNLAELGYQYFYDEKNRLVEKQLPGKGREFMVYDNQDRLTLQQDINQRTAVEKGWTFFKYDKFGRIVYTGFFKNTASRGSMQTALNNKKTPNNEERVSSVFANNGQSIYYTNAQFPNGSLIVQSVNYYDHYQNLGVTPSSIDNQNVIGADDTKTKGLAVASYINVLGETTWNKSYTYYDAKYIRPIASHLDNYLGGYQTTASILDFRGKVKNTVTKHKPTDIGTEILIQEEFDYYPNELLKYQTHQINNNPKEYIVQNSYNEINQLTSKKVGNSVASNPLQTVDYKYNIRGWMTDINNIDITEIGNNRDLFSFRLNYDKITRLNWDPAKFKPLHNGNISETIWKTDKDNTIRSYNYQYDGLNRLIEGTYIKGQNQVVNAYNEVIKGYDLNGNIKGIIRSGEQDLSNNMIWIDDTNYTYQSNSNKLLAVTDNPGYATQGFIDGNTNGDDYAYDVNGNLTKDLNKGITGIKYNYLNLPTEVLWGNGDKISYVYDANGIKLAKYVQNHLLSNAEGTYYINGFQYSLAAGKGNQPILQFFPTAEGYVNVTDGTAFNYVYNYTDHLGNVRLSYQKEANGTLKVLEENNYYPFGLKHSAYNNTNLANANYKYKYTGKELQDELGLNVYDFGARFYMPDIGRWGQIDPLAIAYNQHSPYNYSLNNPVYFKDPDGKRVIANDKETQNTILGYITDQLGENHGFSFNKKGELNYKNKDLKKASKGFNDEQKSIASGLKEVIDGDNVIEVHMNADSDQFTVNFYEPGFVFDQEGKYVPDGQGGFKREGWQKTGYAADLNTQNTGGALFWAQGKLDKTNMAYGHIAINRQTASTIQIQGEGGKLTTPSESSVFIHEILDHGLDFIRNGNINNSSGPGVENVNFHNQALKNISNGESPLRNTHYD